MTPIAHVSVVVEGHCDEPIVRRILSDHGFEVKAVYGRRGKDWLDARLSKFNDAAKYSKWLVLRDLDRDANCAADLIRSQLPIAHKGMLYRIAVRALEAWRLADARGIAKFFRVAAEHIPLDPEKLPDPKAALVNLANKSKLRAIRADMVPDIGTTARVGPAFVSRVDEFARSEWSWERAATRSESLRRCIERVSTWT